MPSITITISADELRQKLNVRNGFDAPPVDESAIVSRVLSSIPPIVIPQPIVPKEETAGDIRNKLNLSESDLDLLRNLPKTLEELRSIKSSKGGARKTVYTKAYNLTSQVNGSLKAFILPIDTLNVIGVFGTQFPITFDSTNDFTFIGRTLTLTSAVSAPTTGQTLWALIEVSFYY